MRLRAEVVAAAQEMLRLGLVTGSAGNVSVRDHDELVYITPAALEYPAMTPDDLVTLALDGTVLAGERPPSSEWRVHVAIYAARPDVRALVHTHSERATAWSARGEPLRTASGTVLTAALAPAGSDEVASAAVAALGDREAVLLARHGVVGVGSSPARALEACRAVERSAPE